MHTILSTESFDKLKAFTTEEKQFTITEMNNMMNEIRIQLIEFNKEIELIINSGFIGFDCIKTELKATYIKLGQLNTF